MVIQGFSRTTEERLVQHQSPSLTLISEIFRAFLAHSGQIIKEKLTSSRPKRNNSRPGILHLSQFKSLTSLNDGESITKSESGSSIRGNHQSDSPPPSVLNSARSSMLEFHDEKDAAAHYPESDDEKVDFRGAFK